MGEYEFGREKGALVEEPLHEAWKAAQEMQQQK